MTNYKKYIKNIGVKAFAVTALFTMIVGNANAQMKVMAAPINLKKSSKQLLNTQNNIPEIDSVNIYNEMINDEVDEIMDNHPAYDIYEEFWSNTNINPYQTNVSQLPDSVIIDCKNFISPVDISKIRVSSNFGPRWNRFHYGIDIAIPTGNDVVAAFDGKVRMVRYNRGGYGKYVVIRHNNGLETVYGHLSAISCEVNQDVKAGEVIAKSGNTGRSSGPHLHFETRYIGNAFNPAKMINFKNGEVYANNYTLKKSENFAHKIYSKTSSKFAKYYKVRGGDTLGHIARRNGTTVSKLKKINGMRSTKIRKGQRIRIR